MDLQWIPAWAGRTTRQERPTDRRSVCRRSGGPGCGAEPGNGPAHGKRRPVGTGASSYTARAVRLRHSRRRAIPRRAATGLPCLPMHDPAYKLLFSDPRMVADLLRGFVPGDWNRSLDFSTLAKVSPEHVSDTLVQRLGDLLWRVRFRDDAPETLTGGAGELLVMLEFQSSSDAAMGARLLANIAMVHQELIRRGALRGGGRLPPVLPLVFYNGESRWSAAVEVRETIAPVDEVLDEVQPRLRYRVVDAGAMDVEDAVSESRVWALVGLENSTTVAELVRGLGAVFGRFGGPEASGFRAGLYEWARHSPLVRRSAVELPPRRELEGGEMATLLEARAREWERQWYRQGRAEGIEQGRVEGVEQGIERGRAEGVEQGIERGRAEGVEQGIERGRAEGVEQGIERGRAEGVEQGIERGRAEGIEQGIERGRAEERARLYHRQVARKFGPETAHRLSELLGRIADDGSAVEIGEWIIECETGAELLERAARVSGPPDPERPVNATQSTAWRDEGHHRDG